MILNEILFLAKKKIPPQEARMLAEFCFELSPKEIVLQSNIQISKEKIDFYEKCIEKRCNGHSISEIIGKRDFYGLSFDISNDVLTPRPETEWLVDFAKNNIDVCERIIDVGTGSGCIAISLSTLISKEIIGVDISDKALGIAKKNAKKNNSLDNNLSFRYSDLFSNISEKEFINAGIIANLPYIPTGDILSREVLQGDPFLALFSGEDGLDLYRRFFQEIPHSFAFCIFEFHPPQKKDLEQIIKNYLPDYLIEWGSDFSGDIRFGVVLPKC